MPVITAILIENSDNEYLYVYYNIKKQRFLNLCFYILICTNMCLVNYLVFFKVQYYLKVFCLKKR